MSTEDSLATEELLTTIISQLGEATANAGPVLVDSQKRQKVQQVHLVQQEQASLAATIQSTQANWTERARLLARRLASAGEPSAHRHTHEAPENSAPSAGMDQQSPLPDAMPWSERVSWAINLPYGMHEADRSLAVQLLKIELSQSDRSTPNSWMVGVLQKRISELAELAGPEQTSMLQHRIPTLPVETSILVELPVVSMDTTILPVLPPSPAIMIPTPRQMPSTPLMPLQLQPDDDACLDNVQTNVQPNGTATKKRKRRVFKLHSKHASKKDADTQCFVLLPERVTGNNNTSCQQADWWCKEHTLCAVGNGYIVRRRYDKATELYQVLESEEQHSGITVPVKVKKPGDPNPVPPKWMVFVSNKLREGSFPRDVNDCCVEHAASYPGSTWGDPPVLKQIQTRAASITRSAKSVNKLLRTSDLQDFYEGCRVHSAEQWRSKPSDALVVLDWITITTGVTENIGVLFTSMDLFTKMKQLWEALVELPNGVGAGMHLLYDGKHKVSATWCCAWSSVVHAWCADGARWVGDTALGFMHSPL